MGYKWVYDENHILTKIYRGVFGFMYVLIFIKYMIIGIVKLLSYIFGFKNDVRKA